MLHKQPKYSMVWAGRGLSASYFLKADRTIASPNARTVRLSFHSLEHVPKLIYLESS
jgi:hypothetical protein